MKCLKFTHVDRDEFTTTTIVEESIITAASFFNACVVRITRKYKVQASMQII